MTTKLLVRQGGASAAEVDYAALTPRSGAPYLEGNTPLIQVGQAFDNGNSAQGIFKFVDPTALVTALGGLKMKPWAEVKLTEDASGDELILGWMRLTGGDAQRRTLYVPGDDVDLNMQITDCNLDLRGIPFVDGWNRPAETDWERLEALQLVKLNGPDSTAPTVSRDSTDITVLGFAQGHLVERNTPVTLDAVDYPAGTEVADIIADIAEQAGKEYGVVLHHDGGSTHKCLLYVDQEDLDRWQSAVRISDDVADWDPDDPTAPTFEPHWLQGAGNEADFQTVASGVISIWSGTNDNPRTVTVENSGAEADDEVWWVVYNDGESKTETQATRRATWQLADRKLPHNHYKPSILVKAEQAHLVTAGQAIQVKSAVLDRRGPDLTTFKWRRVKQVIIEPAANGLYWLHLSLERTNFRGRSGGPAQPKSTSPKPAPPREPDPSDTEEGCFTGDVGTDDIAWDGINQRTSGGGAEGTNGWYFKSALPDAYADTKAATAGTQYYGSGFIGCSSSGQLKFAFSSLAAGADGGGVSSFVLEEHTISPVQPNHEHAPEWTAFSFGPFTAPVGTNSWTLGRTAGVDFDNLCVFSVNEAADTNDEHAFDYGECPSDSPFFVPSDTVECLVDGLQDQIDNLNDAVADASTGITLQQVQTNQRFPIWGHRGDIGSDDSLPENTLESVRQCALKGIQGAEVDVRLSSDGTFHLMHDSTVDRTTNGTGAISSKTDAQIAALTVDGGFGYISGSYSVPTLQAVFDALNPYDFVLSVQLPSDIDTDENAATLAEFVLASGWAHRSLIEVGSLTAAEAIKAVSTSLTVMVNNTVSGADADDNVDWLSMEYDTVTSLSVVTGKAPQHVKSYISIDDFPLDETSVIQNMWDRGVSAYQTANVDFALVARNALVYGGSEATADAHIADTSDAHDASAISIVDSGAYYTGTDVEAALQEVGASLGDAAGMVTVDPGTVTYDDSGEDVVVMIATVWGIDGDGAYYDDAGAAAGEEAALMYDPENDVYAVVGYNP